MKTSILTTYPALTNQWYAICASRTLSTKPVSRNLLGIPVVLFRNATGQPAVLIDRCPHRNAPLSAGKIHNGCIQCPYHGWAFSAEGNCTHVPGLPEAPPANPNRNVQSFPCKEADGLIYVFAGENPTALPRHPQSTNTFFVKEITFQAELVNALENLLDATHTHYVHSGLIRTEGTRHPVTAETSRTANQVQVRYTDEPRQSGLISRLFEPSRTESFGRFRLPAIGELEYRDAKGTTFLLQSHVTPGEGENLHIVLHVAYRKPGFIPAFLANAILWPFLRKALKQDLAILALQRKIIATFGEEDFRYSPLDLLRPHIIRLLKGKLKSNETSTQKTKSILYL